MEPNSMIASAAPIVFFTKFSLIDLLRQASGFGCQVSGVPNPHRNLNTETLVSFTVPSSLDSRHSLALWIRVDPGNLRSLDTDTTHQSLLVEDKSIDAFLQRCGRQVLAESRVQYNQTRSCPQFKPGAVVEILHRCIVHEKQDIAKSLNPGLKSIGRRQRPIIGDRLAAFAQRPVTELARDNETAFDDARENQHRHRLVAQSFRARRMLVEVIQGRSRLPVDGACVRRQRRSRAKDVESDRDYRDRNSHTYFHEMKFHCISPSGFGFQVSGARCQVSGLRKSQK